MRALLPLLALLTGCDLFNSRVYLDKQVACSYDPFTWFPDIATSLEFGAGGGDRIEWDFPPGPRHIDATVGFYNIASGDYGFHYEYKPEHYGTVFDATGFGTVFTSGDLDILHEVHEEDILGNTVDYRLRHVRTGCSGSIETQWPESSENIDYTTNYEIVSEDEVEYSSAFDYEGGGRFSQTWTLDSTYSEVGHVEESTSDYTYRADYTQNALQRTLSDWTQTSADYRYAGTTDRDMTGFLVQDYTIYDVNTDARLATMHVERNYDGSGTGHYEDIEGGYTCELTYGSDGSCEYECDEGSTGDC